MRTSTFNSLDEIIEKALIALRTHPKNDLDPGYRHAIWAILETPPKNVNQVKDLGKKRRLFLAILSAKYVLPLWEKICPHDDTPHRCLTKAERSLFEEIEPLQDDYMAAIEVVDELEYEPSVMAGYSAVNTLATALWDERFDPENIDYTLTNSDLDPDYLDSALLASCAYAGGCVWEEGSDAKRRLRFWEWWLTEAVPKAWQAFSDEKE